VARPRATERVGGSAINASDLRGLSRAYREGKLVPFLGAGISLAHGVPTWKELVVDLLFEEGEGVRSMSVLPRDERRRLASFLAEFLGYDLTVLARVVKNTARKRAKRRGGGSAQRIERSFLESVRARIYAGEKASSSRETTLSALATFIAHGVEARKIPAVVTFNYDDLLERALSRLGVPHHVVAGDRRVEGRGIPILHPHGFLPKSGPVSEGVVFTEDEYHRLGGAVFHWAHGEIVHHLRRHSALFVGLSMSDPNLRRMLDASYVHGDIPAHWQVQRRRCLPVVPAGEPSMKQSVAFSAKLAERFERELLQSMGTKTIWLESHEDIPALLVAIRGERKQAAPRSLRNDGRLALLAPRRRHSWHSMIWPRSSRTARGSVSRRSSRTS
jgi:hypothetical protein